MERLLRRVTDHFICASEQTPTRGLLVEIIPPGLRILGVSSILSTEGEAVDFRILTRERLGSGLIQLCDSLFKPIPSAERCSVSPGGFRSVEGTLFIGFPFAVAPGMDRNGGVEAKFGNVLGDSCRFLGHREDMPDLLGCDGFVRSAFALGGMSDGDSGGWAAGVPVIATDVPGTRDLILDGENGLLVPPERPGCTGRGNRAPLKIPATRTTRYRWDTFNLWTCTAWTMTGRICRVV